MSQSDHVVIQQLPGAYRFVCEFCGDSFVPRLPCPSYMFTGMMEVFIKQHENCLLLPKSNGISFFQKMDGGTFIKISSNDASMLLNGKQRCAVLAFNPNIDAWLPLVIGGGFILAGDPSQSLHVARESLARMKYETYETAEII